MPKSLTDYVLDWCQQHGWTDLFVDHYRYWAFPPGAVMPLPVPSAVFEDFRDGGCPQRERYAYGLLLILSGIALGLSLLQQSPMPLVLMFSLSAIAVAFFDEAQV